MIINKKINDVNSIKNKALKKIPVVIILDNIRSMYNIGSVFRISDAFKIKKIFLCGISPIPPRPEIHKTALGATESVSWEYKKSNIKLIYFLKNNNYKIIGIEQVKNSQLLQSYSILNNIKYALIFGNEINGISNKIFFLIDEFIEIPQSGIKNSLNISVCAGIVAWEFYKFFK